VPKNPSLKNKPLIIGGGQRGVVSTACYIARIKGVRSAMPMFKALKLCPEAIVVAPRMDAYAEASKEIHKMMNELSPSIEPLSLDEAFIDLKGTEKLHGEPPALSMARLVQRIESEQDGIRMFADLQRRSYQELIDKYQNMGDHLWHLCRGIDNRNVSTGSFTTCKNKKSRWICNYIEN